ncbi:MAG: hypothetical protein ACJ74Z_06390 [Bryobacteraceae bacterium]
MFEGGDWGAWAGRVMSGSICRKGIVGRFTGGALDGLMTSRRGG